MRNHDHCLATPKFVNDVSDFLLGAMIQCRRGFIHYENFGIVIQCARDSHTLPLAPGYANAALSDKRIQPQRERADEHVKLGLGNRSPYRCIINLRIRQSEGDVTTQRIVRKIDCLRNVTDPSLPVPYARLDIDSID